MQKWKDSSISCPMSHPVPSNPVQAYGMLFGNYYQSRLVPKLSSVSFSNSIQWHCRAIPFMFSETQSLFRLCAFFFEEDYLEGDKLRFSAILYAYTQTYLSICCYSTLFKGLWLMGCGMGSYSIELNRNGREMVESWKNIFKISEGSDLKMQFLGVVWLSKWYHCHVDPIW